MATLKSPFIAATIRDAGNIPSASRDGIGMVQIPTKRGETGKAKLVTSEQSFLRQFGGQYDIGVSDLPTYIILMLRNGLQLYVSRLGHYTDVTDKSTLQGTKASGQVGNTPTVVAIGGVNQGTKTFTVLASDLTAFFVAGVKFTISGSTGNDGTYTVVSSALNVADTDIVVEEAIPDATVDGNISYSTELLIASAAFVGDGYNGTTLTITDAASNNAANCDISVSFPDSPDDSDFTFSDVPRAATPAQLASFSALFADINLDTVVGQIPNGVIVLADGAEDISLIDANDYSGDQAEGTGVYAFDAIDDAFRLLNFEPLPAIDAAYKTYAEVRQDIRVEVGTPIGANAAGIEAYLDGTTPYSHSPLNSLFVSVNVGDAVILDPRDLNKELAIPAMLPASISKLLKDSSGNYWFSAGQEDFSEASLQYVRMGFDLASPANRPDYDNLYLKGANAISRKNSKIVYYGGRSTLLDLSKLTQSETIADLFVYIKRELPNIAQPVHFTPNDPISWRRLYRLAADWIKNTLVAGRAIVGIEKENWLWNGDQDADQLTDAQFNNVNDLLQGKYKAQFIFIPIDALKEMTIEVIGTNSNIDIQLAQ